MMEAQEFGARLRELRIQAGLTQRELANNVNVDFTYLSKIENGVLPPPSEKVILRLTEVLNADKDELITLAGRIPADIAQILKNRRALQLLRSERTQKKMMAPSKKERAVHLLEDFKTLSKAVKPRIKYKNFARVAIAIILVMAVGTSLWFASPTRAFEVNISPPASGTLGSTHTFSVQVKIEDNELLPVQSIKLEIYNAADTSKKATLENLPLNTSTEQAHTITEGSGSGSALVAADAEDTWGWFHGSPYAYVDWQQQGYSWSPAYGYGYETTGAGTTWITYTVKWTSPSGWPAGSYRIKALIIPSADQATKTLTRTSDAFSLSTAAAPAVYYPEEEPPPPPVGFTDVSDIITAEGVFTESTTAESDDGWAKLTIDEGTTGLTEEGEPLSEISAIWMPEPPAPPEDTNIISFTYDLGPDGATFDPPITITLTYKEADIPEGVDEEDLVIAFWDGAQWVNLEGPFTIDPVANTISAPVSHFTTFTIIAYIPPVAPPAPPVPAPAPPVPAPAPPVPAPAPPVPVPAPPVPAPAPPAPPVPAPAPPAPPPAVNWWLIGGIVVATAIVVGIVVWLLAFRRTR